MATRNDSGSRKLGAATFSVALLLLAATARATVPSDLCTGNPCVVSGNVTVDPGSNLDFGAGTDLQFAGNAVVRVSTDTDFRARSVTFLPGARVIDLGENCSRVDFFATAGDIDMQGTGNAISRLESNGLCPAYWGFDATGNVTAGQITSHGAGTYAFGGVVSCHSQGVCRFAGKITLGADHIQALAGEMFVDARMGIVFDGDVDAVAPYEGPSFNLVSELGGVTFNGLVEAVGGPDSAGSTYIDAPNGDVVYNGDFNGRSKAGFYGLCGSGHTISINRARNLVLGAPMTLSAGGGTECRGGSIFGELSERFTQLPGAKFTSTGAGPYGNGGSIDLDAAGDVTLHDADVGSGFIDVHATGGAVAILGNLRGGDASFRGCDVFVGATGRIDMRSSTFSEGIFLTASETITVAGKLITKETNRLTLREGAPLISGQVLPPPTVVLNAALPNCRPGPSCTPGGVCGDEAVNCGEQCDDGADNGTPASRCTATCSELPPALRIPGGGAKPFDCPFEWAAELGTVATGPGAIPAYKQSCVDNDASCDFEPAVGRCRFRLWGCAGGADALLGCAAAQVSSVQALTPKPTSPFPFEVAARSALDDALAAFAGGAGPGETCSERFDVDVAAGGRALKYKLRAIAAGKTDADQLQLTCVP